jgi:hypothetical protein
MALDKTNLRSDISKIYSNAKLKIDKSEDPTEGMIDDLVTAIDNYIKSAEIPLSDDIKTFEKGFETWIPIPMDGGAALKATLSPILLTLKNDNKLK